MHGYLPYEYECINAVYLLHVQTLMKAFEARNVMRHKPRRTQKLTSWQGDKP